MQFGLYRRYSHWAAPFFPQTSHDRTVDFVQLLSILGSQRKLHLKSDTTVGRPIEPYPAAIRVISSDDLRDLFLLFSQPGISNNFDEIDFHFPFRHSGEPPTGITSLWGSHPGILLVSLAFALRLKFDQ